MSYKRVTFTLEVCYKKSLRGVRFLHKRVTFMLGNTHTHTHTRTHTHTLAMGVTKHTHAHTHTHTHLGDERHEVACRATGAAGDEDGA